MTLLFGALRILQIKWMPERTLMNFPGKGIRLHRSKKAKELSLIHSAKQDPCLSFQFLLEHLKAKAIT